MYFSQTVKVPDAQGKIVIRKKGSSTYVYYQTERVYNAQRKFNVPKRVVIGKLADENDRSRMFPNEKFHSLFPSIPVASLTAPLLRSNTLRAGSYIVFDKIIKEYQLDSLLGQIFGDSSGLILDLLCCIIVSEDNAGQYYPDYARNHPLFTKGMRVVSDPTVSRLLSGITDDQILTFLDEWNERQDHRQRIYISYDSTNKNTQAGDLDLAEFGHAKADKAAPIINISLAFDKTNRIPLFYEEYPGSVNDVSQLKYLIDKVRDYNYRDIGFILDRGYFSRKNIEYLDAMKFSFLMMVKGCRPLVSQLITENFGSFESERGCHIPGTEVYGKTVEHRLYNGDTLKRCFHICHSAMKMAAERSQLESMLERMAAELKKIEGKEYVVESPYTDFFNCHYREQGSKKIFLFATENQEAITAALKLCGYFCLISSEKMTVEDAYLLYRGRDVSEKLFRADKSFLGSKSMRVHYNEAASAKIFIEFMALIVRSRFYNLLKDEMRRLKVRRNYMTVPAAIRELEKIEMTRRNGTSYNLDYAMTKNQKTIAQAFGLSQDDIVHKAGEIAAELASHKEQAAENKD